MYKEMTDPSSKYTALLFLYLMKFGTVAQSLDHAARKHNHAAQKLTTPHENISFYKYKIFIIFKSV
jgi:hypothetical protein